MKTNARRITSVLAAGALLATGLTGLQGARADLESPITVTQTASPSPVASGSELTYTIDITNTGGSQADEVVFTDQVAGMTGIILTSTVGACTEEEGLVRCEAGSLAGFQPWRVTIRGVVTASNGTTLNNTASVTGTRSSQTFSAASTVATIVNTPAAGPLADLRVSVSAPATAGPEVSGTTVTLTVNNTGTANATDVTVVETMPGGWAFESWSATSLFSCAHNAGTVTCTGGAVNAGANATITLKLKTGDLSPQPNGGPPYDDNTAVVDPYDVIPELNELNNTGSARTIVAAPAQPAGLTITKDDSPDPLRPADLLTYTIVVKNTAATRADSVKVTDGTQGLDAASVVATASIGTTNVPCTVAASEVVCTRKNPTLRLEPNQVMNMTVTGKVVAGPGAIIRNTATVNGNIKNKGQTATATTVTSVRPGVDLTITQRAVTPAGHVHNGAGFRAHDFYDYKIVVGNSGLDDATNVRVREPLPVGVQYLGFTDLTGGGFNCSVDTSNVVDCVGGTVAGVNSSATPGGTVESIVLHLVTPNRIGPISATATVDPANAIFEGDETNNTVTTATNVITGIDLTVMKTGTNPVAPSGTLVYTVTISNIGTQDTTGVVLRDTLPAGVRFREAVGDPTHNFTCSHDGSATGGTIDCVGGILRGTDHHTLPVDVATVTITLFAPSQPGFIKNQVRVDPLSAIPEIDETNNINTYTSEVRIPETPAPGPGGYSAYHSFTITKTHTPDPVAPAGTLVSTITVKNHGTDAAFGVDVLDFLPEGSEFRSADDTAPGPGAFSCTEADGVVRCVDGTLDGTSGQTQAAGDDTRSITVTVFAPRQPGAYTNQAVVDPGDEFPEANETDNSALDTTNVAIGGGGTYRELGLTKTQTSPAGNVAPSGILEWNLEATNTGTDAAFGVTVRDILPAGTTFRSAADTSGAGTGAFTCSESGGTVDCVGGTLDGTANQTPGGQSRTIKVSVFAQAQTGSYTNHAFIDPSDSIAEADETNNEALANYRVALGGGGSFIDLTIDKTDSPDPVEPLSVVTYDLKVRNEGIADAFNVKVKDFLPENATFVSAKDSATGAGAFSCSQAGGVVTCTGGYLAPSGERHLTVKVTAPNQHNVVLVNNAAIDPDNAIAEASEINNTDTTETTVTSLIDLQPSVNVSSLSSAAESDITFTVTNNGTSTANAPVVVTDLPVGVIPLNVSGPDATWSCQITENPISQVTCTGSTLAGGATATFTIHVYTTAQGETVTATTRVDPANTIAEYNETNNTAQASKSV